MSDTYRILDWKTGKTAPFSNMTVWIKQSSKEDQGWVLDGNVKVLMNIHMMMSSRQMTSYVWNVLVSDIKLDIIRGIAVVPPELRLLMDTREDKNTISGDVLPLRGQWDKEETEVWGIMKGERRDSQVRRQGWICSAKGEVLASAGSQGHGDYDWTPSLNLEEFDRSESQL